MFILQSVANALLGRDFLQRTTRQHDLRNSFDTINYTQ